jgi:hypothetical protein
MDLAMTRALSAVAPNIAWVNCLSIYFFSQSLVIPLAAASSCHPRRQQAVNHEHLLMSN